MNIVKVACEDDKLMERADKHFLLVLHIADDEDEKQYSGEFVIIDDQSKRTIRDKVVDLRQDIKA